MRWAALLLPLLAPLPARADPRCAHLGQPAYTALRTVSENDTPPLLARVTVAGPRLRIEVPVPGGARLVTLVSPELHAVFLTTASPPTAMRLPHPSPPRIPSEDRRLREEHGPDRVTLITELRGASGQWHEVERTLCRRDGILMESRQWRPDRQVVTRHSEIRTLTPDPSLFRLPAGFRLLEAPPAPISRRTAPPPG